jgi:hypothetical protein
MNPSSVPALSQNLEFFFSAAVFDERNGPAIDFVRVTSINIRDARSRTTL